MDDLDLYEITRGDTLYKVGICGHFGEGENFLDGQTVKTKILTKELTKKLDKKNIQIVDTHGWKKTPFSLLIKCIMLSSKCKNIIILPAHKGIKVFALLFVILNKAFNRKLHYVVVGGWLPELLERNDALRSRLSKFDGVYVETYNMLEKIKEQGLTNVKYLPNFKDLCILNEEELIYQNKEPYKLCTFSRVSKEKGIEDAIEAVTNVNCFLGRIAYTLDIYGQVEKKYKERFESLKKEFPEYITYKGVVDYNRSVDVLKDYFALLFPTYYSGEGFPGTILDAYASGLPVIATNWRYNPEIIQHQVDGIIYEYKNKDNLQKILTEIREKPEVILNMKKNCLKRAKQYKPEVVISEFINYLG